MSTTAEHPPLAHAPDETHGPVEELVRIKVWEWPVRLSHWLVVGSIAVLAGTGIYIGNPFLVTHGEATRHFAMGTVKAIHFWAAMVFVLAVAMRVVWMFVGNPYARWHQFLPVSKKRLKGILPTIAFYSFLRREPPGYVGHNPLAGAIYGLVFVLYFVMIATGFALLSANAHVDSWLRGFAFLVPWVGGLQTARFVHHVCMWLLLGFVAHHVWSAFLVAIVEKNAILDSIFSGFKFVPPRVAKSAREHMRTNK